MSAKVFINSHSGGVSAVGTEKVSSLIFHELKNTGVECAITTAGADTFDQFCVDAREADDTTMVIVAGGDGTLAMAASAFADTGIPVALLPGGTMNLIAHDLGIGGDIEKAISLLKDSRPLLIDVGMINGRAFLNNVVFGDYADVAEIREQIRDAKSLDERLGAISNIAQTLMSSAPAQYQLRLDDRDIKVDANVLMIANNVYSDAVDMRPRRKRLDRGRLAVYIADSQDGINLIARMIEVVRGEMNSSEAIEFIETKKCVVTGEGGPGLVAIDGEPVELEYPVELTLMPQSLTVLCPDLD